MKKIYVSMIALVAVSATLAQNHQELPTKESNTAKHADKIITSENTRGGGLLCAIEEGFDSGFPATWTNEMTNATENWTYAATGGNPDGCMAIQYAEDLSQQDESLVTAAVDLSAITNPGLYFDWFMSYYWGVDPNDNYDLTVAISTDEGASWTDLWTEVDYGAEFDNYAWYSSYVDLSAYSTETSAMFRFNYNGSDGAQAQFDNINFCSIPANDLRIDKVYAGDVINDYIYTKIPQSQAVEVIAGAVTSNFGIATQNNVSYAWEVMLDGTSVASGTESGPAVFAAGEIDSVWVSTGYTPTSTGDVSVTFTVSADEVESVPADNTMSEAFLVTDFTWGHDYEDEDYGAYGYATTDEDAAGGFEFGAKYFCQVDGDFITALQFPLGSTTSSQSVIVKVYQDATADGSVSETVYDLGAGDLSTGAPNFITVVLDDPVPMLAGSVYTATVAINAGDDGYIVGNAIDDNDAGHALYFVDIDTWYNWVGLTTAMRLNTNPDITGVEENNDVSGVYIFPNPATDLINVGFVSKENQNVTANIISSNGSLIQSESIIGKAGQSSSVRFNTTNLSAGIYMVQLVGANSTLTQTVVVQ